MFKKLFLSGSILLLTSCYLEPQFHNVKIHNDGCIYPETRYTYKTGNKISFQVDGELFVIPANFETDLASIPRWYWSILAPQYSAFMTPSIIHDYFYRCSNAETRNFADEVLYYSLINNGVSKITAYEFYIAVRLFGAHSYFKSKICEEHEKIFSEIME